MTKAKEKKWHTVYHKTFIGMNFCEWHYQTWMQHFPASRPWWTFLTGNQKIIEIWGNCPNFGRPKNRNFPNIWLNCVLLIKTSRKDNLPQQSQANKRKMFKRSNLQSGLGMAYRPQTVVEFIILLYKF